MYGRNGNTPAFIEKSADILKAVKDIVMSRTFDNGIMPGAEQSVVVDKTVLDEVIKQFELNGAYFLKTEESNRLKELLFDSKGRFKKAYIGKSAKFLANRVGINISNDVKLLISKEKYVSFENWFSKEKCVRYYLFM